MWNACASSAFDVPTGTKQGGILSADYFALYVHDLIERSKSSGFGREIINLYCKSYYLPTSLSSFPFPVTDYKKMLSSCVASCKHFCLDFHVMKSKLI